MKISEVCSRDLVSVPAGAPLSEVARLMRERNVGAVVVTKAPADQPVVVGIITDRDIVCAQLERAADLSRLEAEQVMTRNPLVLNEDDSIENAIRHLRARGVRRAPVVSAHGTLVGMISTDDLVGLLARELAQLAHLLEQHTRRRVAAAPSA